MIRFSSLHNAQAPAPAPVPRFCRDSLATVLTSSLLTQAFKITSTLASDVCQQMTASEVCSYQPVVTPFLASAALICIHSLWPLPLLWMETPSGSQVQTRSQHLDACRNLLKLILILAIRPVMNLQEPNSGRAWSRKWERSVAVGECIQTFLHTVPNVYFCTTCKVMEVSFVGCVFHFILGIRLSYEPG